MIRKNSIKDDIQNKALELSKNNNNIVLEWATGTGKTYASVKIIDHIIKNNKSAFGYLICKESTHLKNWLDDIKLHGMEHILSNTDSLLYASLHKKIKKADYIILDECHAITPKRFDEIKRLIGKDTKLIFLSATIPEEKKYLIELLCKGTQKYYKITLIEAIDLGLLPKPKVYLHNTTLDNSNIRKYNFQIKKGKGIKKLQANYNDRWKVTSGLNDYDITVMCNELEYYTYLTDQMDYLKKKAEDIFTDYFQRMMLKNKFLNIASQRKKFIAKVKTNKARDILHGFKATKSRFICFSGSIEQSIELGAKSSINSKNKKSENQELIDGFNSKMYSELHAVNMIREGINFVEIQKGLIIQLDSTAGSYFQMMGRMMRHKFPEIHLIRLNGTQDEKYFERAMVDFKKEYIEEVK